MSFAKARQLLQLAEMSAARHGGVTLQEIAETFDVDHRTAQRMVRALEDCFGEVEVRALPDRRRAWKLRDLGPARYQGLDDEGLAALDISIRAAERGDTAADAAALRRLRDRLIANAPAREARRAESDAEALLEARGFVARPGPRTRIDPAVAATVTHALKGPFRLRILYVTPGGAPPVPRIVEPHGLLVGPRRYLVARQPDRGPELRHFRLDRIHEAEALAESFARDPDFDIDAHAARAFGLFQSAREYGEVVWRFAPRAAAHAREFVFHPDQQVEEQPDGGLVVRFSAAGWTEMAWHLYQWGDSVEVLAPEPLRRMVEDHRRSDFEVLP
ncbi:WYL domain-containing transcriptional regulator [Albimonas sp. CAU 1670]|uniref:helix-turn-helix transcriptional regulator n=1 Tax=Albimonas sp. CAU 1670 TaxID=3032599 RepID=UPI0023DBB3DA|nr:WYL domain-containing transcriptional regulator [Albimonas sp. CAU 1670]MDF2230984.1 WYL domain-containing transcriptional regulator [Albimonas sp. CAU 1670]